MLELVLEAFLSRFYLPTAFFGLLAVYFASSLQASLLRSRILAVTVAAGATLQVLLWLPQLSSTAQNVLWRDILACGVVSLGCNILGVCAALNAERNGYGGFGKFMSGTVVFSALFMFFPIIVLLVHCTSGDCL